MNRPFLISIAGHTCSGDTLAEQLDQTGVLIDTPVEMPLVDLDYHGREVDTPRIPHRGKPKRISQAEKGLFKRRHAVEPNIGHLKADHRMRRNFLKGALGDAVNPILAAAGFNIRSLMRQMVIFWRWILSGVLRLLDQAGTDVRSNTAPAAG